MSEFTPRVGGSSPWDRIQTALILAPGIVSVSTAGHGGIWISPEREHQIPANVRAIARQYAPAPWYEEDCDCVIPALWFAPELEATQADFIRHCRQYANLDPRMRPLIDALAIAFPDRVDVQGIILARAQGGR